MNTALPDDKLIELYRKMILIREMEQMHERLLQEGRIDLYVHLGTGQEAVPIGLTGPLNRDDFLYGTHRGFGEYIGKGMSPLSLWLEYMGKAAGPCKGKGAIHLADRNLGIPGLAACLGSDFSMAVGAALAAKMRKTDQVVVFLVGEGSFNAGDAGPSMCMASLWRLPLVIAVCNNEYCEMGHYREHHPTADVAPRAAGYDIPYEIVDGQEIETTYEASRRAVDHARGGGGPYLVEYKTFRRALHYSGDPGGYMNQEDLDRWAKRDPIDLCRKLILERGVMTPEADEALREEIGTEVSDSAAAALASPDPEMEELFNDVFAQRVDL